jgi:AraC-like DNA-binding protein
MARLNESRIGSLLGDRYGVRASTGTVSTLHAQHGAALFVTLDAPLAVADARGNRTAGRVVLVPPDLSHVVHSPGPVIGICYDPECVPAVAARSRCRGGAYALDAYDGRVARRLLDQAQAHRGELTKLDVLTGIADEAARVVGVERARPLDTRVAAVVEALRDREERMPRLGISRSHLAELFLRDVGVPIRSYRLWRRLLRALLAFAEADATTAAHRAGFADLAHFSRTCRKLLGYTPTALRDGI